LHGFSLDDVWDAASMFDHFKASLNISHSIRSSFTVLFSDELSNLFVISSDEADEFEHISLTSWIKAVLLKRGTRDQVGKASLALATIALNYSSDDWGTLAMCSWVTGL
jgi:hypothetical protein